MTRLGCLLVGLGLWCAGDASTRRRVEAQGVFAAGAMLLHSLNHRSATRAQQAARARVHVKPNKR